MEQLFFINQNGSRGASRRLAFIRRRRFVPVRLSFSFFFFFFSSFRSHVSLSAQVIQAREAFSVVRTRRDLTRLSPSMNNRRVSDTLRRGLVFRGTQGALFASYFRCARLLADIRFLKYFLLASFFLCSPSFFFFR